MLSINTYLEIVHLIENWTTTEIDRFVIAFDIDLPKRQDSREHTKAGKANIILAKLKATESHGSFSDSFQSRVLQYLIDNFYRQTPHPKPVTSSMFNFTDLEESEEVNQGEAFNNAYPRLANSLKRDGYIIKSQIIQKLIPEAIEEARTESELMRLLTQFNFTVSKGHLDQAIANHSQSNWAGANSQFRTFTELLLMEISNKLLPNRTCTNAGDAIQWLSTPSVLSPVFLSEHLNEVKHANCNHPFVNGLWKRLHPHGSHPGLSDEEDSTFRYHMTIVFARYLLSRLDNRL